MSDSLHSRSPATQLFFLLGITPLLGASLELGPAVIYGFLFLVVLTSVTILSGILRESAPPAAVFPSALGLALLLTTLFDILLTLLLPATRKTLGVYLNLLALNPLILSWAIDQTEQEDWVEAATESALNGLKFWGLISLFGFVRELLGKGTLSFATGQVFLTIPFLDKGPFHLLVLPAGALFLAAIAAAVFKWLEPRWQQGKPLIVTNEEAPALPEAPAPPAPQETQGSTVADMLQSPPSKEPQAAPAAQAPAEPAVEAPRSWGENLEEVVRSFASFNEKCRFLVVGSGSGEMVYYLAMLGHEIKKENARFDFLVRGTENFPSRISGSLEGIYRESQLEFIPLELKQKYLLRSREDDKHLIRVIDEIRPSIEFVQADFLQNKQFFNKPCNLIVLNQSIDFLNSEKQTQFFRSAHDNLTPDGALLIKTAFHREFIPEGFRRTGDQVFRKK